MIARSLANFFAIAALVCGVGQARQLRCGGVGPNPFNDISGILKYNVETVDAVGGVKEFLYQESSNALIYRNANREIRGVRSDSAGNFSQAQFFSTSIYPMSRVVDPKERFVLTEGQGWLLDTNSSDWFEFNPNAGMQHLFWNRNKLFSYQFVPAASGDQRWDFYSYRVGDNGSKYQCSIQSTAKVPLTMAHGHTYPLVFFFNEVNAPGSDRQVVIYPFDITNCTAQTPVAYSNVRGPVKDVYRFDSIDSTAVVVDNKDQNLLWATPKGCGYYDIKGLTPIVPNYNQPAIATFSQQDGVTLFFLNTEKRATVLKGFPINDLKEGDLWLSDSGRKLFMSPLFDGERSRWLLDLKLASDESNPSPIGGVTPTKRSRH